MSLRKMGKGGCGNCPQTVSVLISIMDEFVIFGGVF